MKTYNRTLSLVGAFLLSIVSMASAQTSAESLPLLQTTEPNQKISEIIAGVENISPTKIIAKGLVRGGKKIVGNFITLKSQTEIFKIQLLDTYFNEETIKSLRIDYCPIGKFEEMNVIVDHYLDGNIEIGLPNKQQTELVEMKLPRQPLDPTKFKPIELALIKLARLAWQKEYERVLNEIKSIIQQN